MNRRELMGAALAVMLAGKAVPDPRELVSSQADSRKDVPYLQYRIKCRYLPGRYFDGPLVYEDSRGFQIVVAARPTKDGAFEVELLRFLDVPMELAPPCCNKTAIDPFGELVDRIGFVGYELESCSTTVSNGVLNV